MFYIYTGVDEALLLDKAREYAKNHALAQDVIEVTNEHYNMKKESNQLLVDAVRKARYDVYIKPYGDKKVIIFPNAERLNTAGQNVLLKVLEEPPYYADFILITKNPHMLLPTVRSRAQIVRFSGATGTDSDDELWTELQKLINSKSDRLYRVIEFFIAKKDEKDDIFTRAAVCFNKNMLRELQKGDRILSGRYANCVILCENAQNRISANGNYSMTVNKTLLAVWEEVNIDG